MQLTRREFAIKVTTLAIGTGLASIPKRAQAIVHSAPSAMFTLGIGSYTFRKLPPGVMIDRLHRLQIDTIELSHPQFMLPRAKVEDFGQLPELFKKGNIQVRSWYCAGVNSSEDIQKVLEIAKILGVQHVSGDATGDSLLALDEAFQKNGLYFGIHNHFFKDRKFEYQSPEDFLKVFSLTSDHIGATLDTGHMVSCGYDPIDAFHRLKPRVQLVHLKDVVGPGTDRNVLFGTGKGKTGEMVKMLAQEGFEGLVAIEYEEGEDPQEDVEKCVKFVRSVE
jgi:sugar phosphate isomerase/epimerase